MTEYTRKVVKGTAIVFILTVLAAIFGYLTRLIIARNLSPEEYGLIYAIFALFGIFSIIQQWGLNDALAKYIAEFLVKNERSKIKTAIIFSFVFRFFMSSLIATSAWIFADWLAFNYFKMEIAAIGIKIYALAVLFIPIENTFASIFRGFQKQTWYSMVNILRMLFIFIATVILLYFNKSIISPILAYLLVYILSFTVYLPLTLKKLIPNFFTLKAAKIRPIAKKLLYFGIPIMISIFSANLISQIDIVMLTGFRNLNEVALYSVAIPTASLLWYFGSAIGIVLLPLSSEIWKRRQDSILNKGINLIYKYSIIGILPFTILMLVFPEVILSILFGGEYTNGARLLRILSIAALFFTIGQVNTSILSGINKPKINAKITGTATVINFAINLILIPQIGVIGAGISTLVSFSIIGIFGTVELKKRIRFKIPFKDWAKTALAGVIFLFVTILLKNLLHINLIPKIVITLSSGLIAYFLIIFIIKAVEREEIRTILKRAK